MKIMKCISSALAAILIAPLLTAQNKQPADLLIIGGTVVTMDSARAIIEDGALAVTGDTIAAVGPRAELESKFTARQTIDAKNTLILPGFINGHTHVPMTLFRGIHDDLTLNDS